MNNAILTQLVTPPSDIVEAGVAQKWQHFETLLGTSLPKDYKNLIQNYGSGGFQDFFYVFNPFSSTKYYNLIHQKDEILTLYAATHQRSPEKAPYPPYPSKGGILPCAITKNGDEFYWETAGNPDDWPVIVFPARRFISERYELTLSQLLHKFIEGTMTSKIILTPDEFDGGSTPCFTPRSMSE